MGNWDVELNPNKDGVKTELLIKQDAVNLIDELNAISFYEANEHSRECYYDIRNAVIAMQPVASCSDAISRQGLLDTIDRFCDLGKRQLKEIVRDLPPVTPKQKIGHWIAQDVHNCHTDFKCSECGYIHSFMHLYGKPTADYTYCPNCGRRMVEPQESEV